MDNGGKQNFKIQAVIAVLAVVLLAFKFLAWYLTGSVAVLTDALESIVNVIAALVGLYSLYLAARPSDVNHPYGHGKIEFISAAVEGTLIGIAGIATLYKGILQVMQPAPLQQLGTGMWIVAATGLVNYIAGYICVATGKKNRSIALEVSGRHLKTDTYSTVAVVAALALVAATGIPWLDGGIAVLLALFICYTSYTIIRRSVAGIMDEADQQLLEEMVASLNKNRHQNWVDLHNLRVIKYGTILHIDCHLTVPWYLNVYEAHDEVDALSAAIKARHGHVMELFVHSDGCETYQCPICIKGDCPVRKYPFQKQIEWTVSNVSSNQKHGL